MCVFCNTTNIKWSPLLCGNFEIGYLERKWTCFPHVSTFLHNPTLFLEEFLSFSFLAFFDRLPVLGSFIVRYTTDIQNKIINTNKVIQI